MIKLNIQREELTTDIESLAFQRVREELVISPDRVVSAGLEEPTAQPTSLVFDTSGYPTTLAVSWTAASPAPDGYIAIIKLGSAPTSDPVDDTTYLVDDALGDGIVAHVGTGLSFDYTCPSDGTYYVKIYSYNEA